MTANDNTKHVQSIFEAFGRGDVGYILSQLSDDATFVANLDPAVPWAGTFTGNGEITQYFTALGSSVEVLSHPVTSLVTDGDTVVARGEVTFRVRASGREGSSAWVYIFELADGRLHSFDQYNDAGLTQAFAS